MDNMSQTTLSHNQFFISFLLNVWEHQEIYEVTWKFVLDF